MKTLFSLIESPFPPNFPGLYQEFGIMAERIVYEERKPMGTSAAKRQAWIDHIAAWTASGQTQRGYCEAYALSYHTFDYWRRFVLRQDASLIPPQSLTPLAATEAATRRAARGGNTQLDRVAETQWPRSVRLPQRCAHVATDASVSSPQ